MKTKILILCMTMVFLLACLVTPPPKVVTSPHVYTIPTMQYGAEPDDWRPPLYVIGAKSAGRLDEQKGTK